MAQGQRPGFPETPVEWNFQGWDGVDTKPPRGGIADKHAAWMDNIMPLGENNARAMPDRGPTLYTATGGLTITWYGFFTLTKTGPCAIAFLSDGSAVQVAAPQNTILSPGKITNIAAAGTFAPTVSKPYAFQSGAQYLIIIAEQTNGYWIWDGANLFGAGTLAPVVTITNSGNGITGPVSVAPWMGGGPVSGSLSATVIANAVSAVTVTFPGAGYVLGQQPILLFSGTGFQTACGTIGYGNGVITLTLIVNGGSGFTAIPTIVINDPGGNGTGASIIVNAVSGGIITGLEIISGGQNYSPLTTLTTTGGGGSGFLANVTVTNGVVNSFSIVNVGAGYIGEPTVNIVTVSGTVTPGSGAAATAQMANNGTLQGLTITSGGSGYTGTVAFYLSGGGGPPSATVQLMPFGIQGSSGDVNGGIVWVSSIVAPVKVFFSAPGVAAPQDFSVADGSGAFPPNDSHLQYQYTVLKAASGEFLYLIGDSSIDYESGAQTSGTPPITRFSKLNVDQQIGTIWRDSAIPYGRSIVFANVIGIYTIYGGAVTKISPPLDGIYPSAATLGAFLPSSAIADIFNVRCYMLLIPIIDPISGVARNALLMWDGRRMWTASQSTPLVMISAQEYASSVLAWGTDGTTLFPLFQAPSNQITKTILTKFWTKPSIAIEKRAFMMYALWKSAVASALSFAVDIGATSDPANNPGNASTPVTQGSFMATAGGDGFGRSKTPNVGGIEVGFRMSSTSPDFQIIDMTMIGQEWKTLY